MELKKLVGTKGEITKDTREEAIEIVVIVIMNNTTTVLRISHIKAHNYLPQKINKNKIGIKRVKGICKYQ